MLFNQIIYEKNERGKKIMAPRKKAAAAAAEVKEVKEEVKAEVAAVEEAVEAPAKKPAAKKPAAKKAPAKAKAEAKAEVYIEFGGVQVAVDEIVKNAKLTVGEDKDVKIYVKPDVKPDESKAYIVADEESVAMDVYFC